jgi:hypothetical protein
MKKDNAEEQFIVTQFPSAFSDEFHGLHDSLSAEAAAGRSQAIQFAASQRGEGVTTILLGFGIFLSELYGSGHRGGEQLQGAGLPKDISY